jgi:hypothetical protein
MQRCQSRCQCRGKVWWGYGCFKRVLYHSPQALEWRHTWTIHGCVNHKQIAIPLGYGKIANPVNNYWFLFEYFSFKGVDVNHHLLFRIRSCGTARRRRFGSRKVVCTLVYSRHFCGSRPSSNGTTRSWYIHIPLGS